jgi:hypothetical protein
MQWRRSWRATRAEAILGDGRVSPAMRMRSEVEVEARRDGGGAGGCGGREWMGDSGLRWA